MKSPKDALRLLCQGCDKVHSEDELYSKLCEGRPLRVKLGVDPTAPDIHLGHSIALKQTQAVSRARP